MRIARTTSARRTSICTSMPKRPHTNPGVLITEPPEKFVSEGDGVQKAPPAKPPTRCQTERPEDLPSGRGPCHEKSKGFGAAVGSSHKQAETKNKTQTTRDGDACTTERTTTRTATFHHPLCRRCLCCVCCALRCRVRCALCSQVHSSVRCHPFLFYQTAPDCR